MNLHSPTTINGENLKSNNNNGDPFFEDIDDSTCSTPYVSAPSSPGRGTAPTATAFFYSAPASPMHFAITSLSHHSPPPSSSCDFEFSARFGSTGSNASGSMSSADELFLNGQIRPMKLSTHLERPQVLAPLLDLEEEEEEENDIVFESHVVVRGRDLRSFRDKSLRRRTRSLSPLRNTPLEWTENEDNNNNNNNDDDDDVTVTVTVTNKTNNNNDFTEEDKSVLETTPSVSASSSRSSSAGRSSKRWVFLKDFIRSKSEGRSNNKFWSTISFSVPTKEKKGINQNQANGSSETPKSKGNSQSFGSKKVVAGKPTNGVGKRRAPPSAHELHYKANRAQAEELRKKTFLPYRQGLLGCLGFSSKGYGVMNGYARALNPVSSR